MTAIPAPKENPVNYRRLLAVTAAALSEILDDVHDQLDPDTRDQASDHPHGTEQDSPTYQATTWTPAFAGDVKSEDLIAVHGSNLHGEPAGMRALRVTRAEPYEQPGPFGGPGQGVSILAVDVDEDKPQSFVAGTRMPLMVAVSAPDTVPADLDGRAP